MGCLEKRTFFIQKAHQKSFFCKALVESILIDMKRFNWSLAIDEEKGSQYFRLKLAGYVPTKLIIKGEVS